MLETYRRYGIEFVGTFILVLFSAGVVSTYQIPSDSRPEVSGIALVQGLTLAILLSAVFGKQFGCFNPAITVSFYIFKRLSAARALIFIGLQLLAALLAGLVLRTLFNLDILQDSRLGTPHLKAFLDATGDCSLASLLSGFGVEVVLTGFLAFAVFGAFFDGRSPQLGGLLPGLAQVVIVILGFHLTGGCGNPATWFGPMFWEYTLPSWVTLKPAPLMDHVVYWAGPVTGAFLGGLIYSVLILPRKP